MIHQWLVDSPHKGPVTQKMFPFDIIMVWNRYKQVNGKIQMHKNPEGLDK